MKPIATILCLTIAASTFGQPLTGEWKGAYILNSYVTKFNIYILGDAAKQTVHLDLPESNRFDLSCDLLQHGDSLKLSRINNQGNLITFEGKLHDGQLSGRVIMHSESMKDKPGMFQLMKSNAAVFKGQQMPDFELVSMEDQSLITKDRLKDRYYMLDFWATWCKPCVAKRPGLMKIKETLGDKLEIISISLDDSPEVVSTFRKAQFEMPWLHVLKAEKWDDDFIKTYLTEGLPYGYLVNPEGTVVAMGRELDEKNLLKTAERLIK